MINRRALTAGFALAPLFSSRLLAAERTVFTPEAFAAAQAAGKPIFVDISATWCPTCKAQKPTVDKLSATEAYKSVVIFDVDFDDQKDVVRSLGANAQSTLIAYKGGIEVDRTVGATDPAVIEAMFSKAVSG